MLCMTMNSPKLQIRISSWWKALRVKDVEARDTAVVRLFLGPPAHKKKKRKQTTDIY